MSSAAPEPVPLLLLGETRRRRLLEHASRIVADWHGGWASEGVPAPLVEVAAPAGARPPEVGRESLTLAALADDERVLQVETDIDFAKALCIASGRERRSFSSASPQRRLEAQLTEDAVGALAASLVRAAWPSRLCAVRKRDAAEVGREDGVARPSALRIRVRARAAEGGPALELELTPQLAEALLGARPPVTTPEFMSARRQAADAERLTVTVSLGSASVSWRDLQDLSVGDAIVLDQDLGSPLTVAVGASKTIAEARLGRVDKALAVQIARIHSQERRERR